MKRYRGAHPKFLGLKFLAVKNFNNSEFKFLGQTISANLNVHIFRFQIALNVYLGSFPAKCLHRCSYLYGSQK